MKKILTTLFAISTLFAAAQIPQGINYQSIIRNTGGVVLPSTPVAVEFKLYASPSSTAVLLYDEIHSATTNSFGMVNLVIGQGSVVGGIVAFNNIPWIAGIHYEVYVNSSLVGSRQAFMSVPYALHAPAPAITFSNNTLSVGGNTVSISTGPTYTAGTGIAISGNTITNNAPDQTVSLTGLGSATVTGAYPNFTVETPTVSAAIPPTIVGAGSATVTSAGNTFTVNAPVYTAGSGIDISSGGLISNTAVAVTPIITGMGSATVTSAGNTFTVNTPVPQIYTAGSDIFISSGAINNAAPDKTVTITAAGSATVTGSYPNFTLNVPNGTVLPNGYTGQLLFNNGTMWDTIPRSNLYFDGTNFGIGTQSPQMNFHVVGAGRFDASITTPQIYTDNIKITGGTAGQILTSDASGNGTWQSPAAVSSTSVSAGSSNITVSQSGNSYTITPVTPVFTNMGPTTITGTYPNYTVSSTATPTTTLVPGANITLTPSGNTYTVSAVTPTLTVSGGVLTGSYPTQTLTIPTSSTTAITASTNVIVSGSAPNYTISSPSQSLAIAGNSLSITGSNTVTIPVSTVIAGNSNITVTPAGNIYSVSAITPTLNVSGGVLTGSYPNQTLTIPTSSTTVLTASTNIVVTGSAPNYTVSSTAPVLALSGTTLTSGPATNSVNLSGFNGIYGGSGSLSGNTTVNTTTNSLTFLKSANTNSSTVNFVSGATSNPSFINIDHTLANSSGLNFRGSVATSPVLYGSINSYTTGIAITGGLSSTGIYATAASEAGVGTYTTGLGKFIITHGATATAPTMHLRETSATGLTRMKFSNTNVANSFFEIATDIKATFNTSALSINVNDAGNVYNPVFLVSGGRQVYVNALNLPLASFHVMENASTSGGGIISEGFGQPGQMVISRNNQTGTLRLAVTNGNELGRLLFAGFNGAAYNGTSSKIAVNATENYTGSNQGAEMVFSTVPNGSTVSQEVMRLTNDGRVEVKNGLLIPYGGPSPGKVLTSDASGNASWMMPPGGPWSRNSTTVTLTNPGDWVGIGTATPNGPFQVQNYISFESNGSNTALGFNTGGGISPNNYYNTFVGAGAGQQVGTGTGQANSFLGYHAGQNTVNGYNNTFMGTFAGESNNTGSGNAFFGGGAGRNNSTGINNVFVGSGAGNNSTTAQNNTFLGAGTDLSSSTQYTNATAIGANARANDNDMVALGSNADVVIGGTKPGLISGATRYLTVANTATYAPGSNTSLELQGYTNSANASAARIDFINGLSTTAIARVEAITGSGSTVQGALRFFTNAGTLTEAMRITTTGSVGIGTTNPGGLFELGLDQGRKPGTTVWTVTSDERLKTIEGTYTKGLNEILQLNPVQYHYKNVGERTFKDEVLKKQQIGFSAQQVQRIFPEAVEVDADGYLSLNIHAILIAYTNAVKELNDKAEEQKKTIEEQKKLIENLEANYGKRLQALEELLKAKTQK